MKKRVVKISGWTDSFSRKNIPELLLSLNIFSSKKEATDWFLFWGEPKRIKITVEVEK